MKSVVLRSGLCKNWTRPRMDRVELGDYEMSIEGVLTHCDFEIAGSLMADEGSRIVANTNLIDTVVSTTFLAICLTFEDGSPQAFETTVIRGHKSVVVKRYSDLAEALRGHDATARDLAEMYSGS